MFYYQDKLFNRAVSVIFTPSSKNPSGLKRFLSSFFKVNSQRPFEIIVIDDMSMDKVNKVVKSFSDDGFIYPLAVNPEWDFAKVNNLAAEKAIYPNLLFVSAALVYEKDVLPRALKKLGSPSIGAVGARLDDYQENLPVDTIPSVYHAGISFTENSVDCQYRPYLVGAPSLAAVKDFKSGFYSALGRDFLLCRREDFHAVGGFCERLSADYATIDLCLQFRGRLGKKSYCINDIALGRVRERDGFKVSAPRLEESENDRQIFLERNDETIPLTLQESRPLQEMKRLETSFSYPLRILYILPGGKENMDIYQVAGLIKRLLPHNVEALMAVPPGSEVVGQGVEVSAGFVTYDQVLAGELAFTGTEEPDLIHVWTPWEKVGSFLEQLSELYHAPLLIHLKKELKMDYGNCDESGLKKLNGEKLPVHISGLTVSNRAQLRKAFDVLPSFVVRPPVDESLFYPRPLNYGLRKELGIPEEHFVLAYCGSVDQDNREALLNLCEALRLLNDSGLPVTLIRTGREPLATLEVIGDLKSTIIKDLGWVERQEVPAVMAAADLLVDPAGIKESEEGLPYDLLTEYMAMGKPILLHADKVVSQLEHRRHAYLIEDNSTMVIAEAIHELAADPQLRYRQSNEAVTFFLDNCSDPVLGEKLYCYYKKVLRAPLAQALIEISPHRGDPDLQRRSLPTLHSTHWEEVASEVEEEVGRAGAGAVEVVPCLENALCAERLPVKSPWLGFVHALPLRIPRHLAKIAPYDMLRQDRAFKTETWQNAAQSCRGLVAFSEQQAARVAAITNLPVKFLRYPLPDLPEKWSWPDYNKNANKKLVQIGWWLMRPHALHILPLKNLEKIWFKLPGASLEELLAKEYGYLKERFILYDHMLSTVESSSFPGTSRYLETVTKNVVFAHYYDCGTLNLILECLSRRIPILINPYGAIREYLGDDYPLYYYYYRDAAAKAVDSELIYRAHCHLDQRYEELKDSRAAFSTGVCELLEGSIV